MIRKSTVHISYISHKQFTSFLIWNTKILYLYLYSFFLFLIHFIFTLFFYVFCHPASIDKNYPIFSLSLNLIAIIVKYSLLYELYNNFSLGIDFPFPDDMITIKIGGNKAYDLYCNF